MEVVIVAAITEALVVLTVAAVTARKAVPAPLLTAMAILSRKLLL